MMRDRINVAFACHFVHNGVATGFGLYLAMNVPIGYGGGKVSGRLHEIVIARQSYPMNLLGHAPVSSSLFHGMPKGCTYFHLKSNA